MPPGRCVGSIFFQTSLVLFQVVQQHLPDHWSGRDQSVALHFGDRFVPAFTIAMMVGDQVGRMTIPAIGYHQSDGWICFQTPGAGRSLGA